MGGAGYAATTAYYFYSFDPADTRRDVTCVFQEYINENGKIKEVIRCNPLGVACGKWRWYWMTDNYMKVRFPKANSRIATGINWIFDAVFRYLPDVCGGSKCIDRAGCS